MKASSYQVSRISGRLNYDSVPVAKIVDYPLEPRDYRPFAQCNLCFDDRLLHLRMWAFEVSPQPTSALHCLLYLFAGQKDLALKISLEHGEDHQVKAGCSLVQGGKDTPAAIAITTHPHNGEDLQGIYWGMAMDIPLADIEKAGGSLLLQPGQDFPGNFYKTSEAEGAAHMGSFFPAQFPANPYGSQSAGRFCVVSY